ncbi:hypothetical protein [Marinobacterium rhizophilum]|uniref:hypothetical protein n=1 Tax=Marinobacterium rhizophilum TaxID=420402 RepID=UPI0012EC5583|nr:hypothetical protein [Marinobacterium rhizophilum]
MPLSTGTETAQAAFRTEFIQRHGEMIFMKMPYLLCSAVLLTSVALTGCGNDEADKKAEVETTAPVAEDAQGEPAKTAEVEAQMNTTGEAVEEKAETVEEKAEAVVEAGKEIAVDAAQAVTETATDMVKGAQDMAADVADGAASLADEAMGSEESTPAEAEEKAAQ